MPLAQYYSQGFEEWAEANVERKPHELKSSWRRRAYKIYAGNEKGGGGMVMLFGKQFNSDTERQAFWDTLMRVLDKKLTDSGLSLSHERIPTDLFSNWINSGGSRSSLLGMKDFSQFDAFIDDNWSALVSLESAPAPAQPISPESIPAQPAKKRAIENLWGNVGAAVPLQHQLDNRAAQAFQQFVFDAGLQGGR